MKVAIIKYNAGNIFSVASAMRRVGVDPIITADKDILRSADKVIFPGVGHAKAAMDHLKQEGLDVLIKELRQPVLGICLGMQIMCAKSDEGDVPCLGIFDDVVKLYERTHAGEKIPHMGWNTISALKTNLFQGLSLNEYVYFVHSYYVGINPFTIAATDYITPFSAAMGRDNFYATQFHPEKSGSVGEQILKNFLTLK